SAGTRFGPRLCNVVLFRASISRQVRTRGGSLTASAFDFFQEALQFPDFLSNPLLFFISVLKCECPRLLHVERFIIVSTSEEALGEPPPYSHLGLGEGGLSVPLSLLHSCSAFLLI
ncbi:hypothetical protein PMAYCL1PPCAC_26293, partial [Pristionchus mayeri]